MVQEPFEVWEHRMSELIDSKLKPIIGNLKKLQKTQESLRQDILYLLQQVAILRVNADTDTFVSIINAQLPSKPLLTTQLFTEASSVKAKIRASNDPKTLANEFAGKWGELLHNLGAEIIIY